MRQTIEHGPAFAMATFDLTAGDEVTVAAGAVVGASDGLLLRTHLGGTRRGLLGGVASFFGALSRKLLGGEPFLVNTFRPPAGGAGRVLAAPALPGEIVHLALDGARALTVRASSFLACAGAIRVRTRPGGPRGLFSGAGAPWLAVSGAGELWLGGFGAVEEIAVDGGLAVDADHVVAFYDTLACAIEGAGDPERALLSGEGPICRFRGQGELLVQTRAVDGLARWVAPRLRG